MIAIAIVAGAVFLRNEMSRVEMISDPDDPAAPVASAAQSSEASDIRFLDASDTQPAQTQRVNSEQTAPTAPALDETPSPALVTTAGQKGVNTSELASPSSPEPVAEQTLANSVPPSSVSVGSTVPLRLRIGPDYPEEQRLELLDRLTETGHRDVLVEEIPFPIALSRVGYYVGEDRDAALELADDVAQLIGSTNNQSVAIRDYGSLLPDAEPGRLDLWVKSPE
ncbi:MAG: hypothetical protein AAGG56_09280 [Pseudomonadota bacterium]